MSADYRTVSELVEPITDLLKALTQLNYLYHEAMEAGWTVDFKINEEGGRVDVSISRDAWLLPDDEQPA